MFTFEAMPVKFVGLLVLYLFCTVWSARECVQPQHGRQRVSNVLHLVMSVVMLLMVARPTWMGLLAIVGFPVLIGFFAASVAWFVWLAADAGRRGEPRGILWHFVGHAAMFGAMTWHLVGMAIRRAHLGPNQGAWLEEASRPGGQWWWVAVVGVPFMAYLLASSLTDLAAALRRVPEVARDHHVSHAGHGIAAGEPVMEVAGCHEPRPVGAREYRLAKLSGFAMNFGMFWMSTGLMVALLPFFSSLSF